jgi:hypothetical protein
MSKKYYCPVCGYESDTPIDVCPICGAKMAVLGALGPLGAKVLDVNIIEPSLEDVYFGLREN